MKALIKKIIKDFFTERDGVSYCPVRIMGFVAACDMLLQYSKESPHNHQAFAIGFAAILASIAGKNWSEKDTIVYDLAKDG